MNFMNRIGNYGKKMYGLRNISGWYLVMVPNVQSIFVEYIPPTPTYINFGLLCPDRG